MDERDFEERLEFHPDINVMEVDFSDVTFETSKDVNDFYDYIDGQIVDTGRRWFFLVNYRNTKIFDGAWLAFANRGKKINVAYSLGTVRYDARPETEEEIKRKSSSEKFDANLFASREAALARLAEMREDLISKQRKAG